MTEKRKKKTETAPTAQEAAFNAQADAPAAAAGESACTDGLSLDAADVAALTPDQPAPTPDVTPEPEPETAPDPAPDPEPGAASEDDQEETAGDDQEETPGDDSQETAGDGGAPAGESAAAPASAPAGDELSLALDTEALSAAQNAEVAPAPAPRPRPRPARAHAPADADDGPSVDDLLDAEPRAVVIPTLNASYRHPGSKRRLSLTTGEPISVPGSVADALITGGHATEQD